MFDGSEAVDYAAEILGPDVVARYGKAGATAAAQKKSFKGSFSSMMKTSKRIDNLPQQRGKWKF